MSSRSVPYAQATSGDRARSRCCGDSAASRWDSWTTSLIASTWADDATPDDDTLDAPGPIPVEVTVTATDRGGETAERTLEVTDNGAPTASTIPNATISGTATTHVITSLVPFFEDPEGATLTYTAVSSDEGIATVAVSGNQLTVTKIARPARR